MALPLPPSDSQQNQPMAVGTEWRRMAKREDTLPFTEGTLQPEFPYFTFHLPTGSRAGSLGYDTAGLSQRLSYASSWIVGMAQGHGIDVWEASTQLSSEADIYPADFLLPGVPAVEPCSNADQLGPGPRGPDGCIGASDWPEELTPTGVAPLLVGDSALPSHTLQCGKSNSLSVKSPVDHDEIRCSPRLEEEGSTGPPYSLLIYQALLSARDRKLPLQGIYSWFEKNTEKGKDQNSKGWQNSIRHNLSMNAGFEAVKEETLDGKKAVNFWRLTEEAAKNGIQSTTRYRKQASCRRNLGRELPRSQRQRQRPRGSKTMKVTSKPRNVHSERSQREWQNCINQTAHGLREKEACLQRLRLGLPFRSTSLANTIELPIEAPSLQQVVGCTDYSPTMSIFSNTDVAEAGYFPLDTTALGWYGMYPATTGGF